MSSNVAFELTTIKENPCDPNRPTSFGDSYSGPKSRSQGFPDSTSDYEKTQKFTGLGLEITNSIIGNLIAHPCVVLRRQCQVNRNALKYHLSPFTLVPVIIRLQKRQGIKVLWKGAGGIFILRGVAIVIETIIAEITPFPREISAGTSLKNIFQHLILKSITYGLLTPFYCASLIETVQSDIASETPGVLDCLKEGIRRLFRWGTPQSSRLLPIWKLIGPTMAYGILNYIISSMVQSLVSWIVSVRLQKQMAKQGAVHKHRLRAATNYLDALSSACLGQMAAEILLFPAETVLNRLYLQGTRTIVDNLDSGISVVPIISKYEGVTDCFNTIVQEEGSMGLYKGFGALLLEYSMQMVLLKAAKFVFKEMGILLSSSKGNRLNN